MAKYSSYPISTSILGPDVVLFHQNATNSERLVSFTNLMVAVNGAIPPATQTTAGSMSPADKTKLDQATAGSTPLTLAFRDGLGTSAFGNLSIDAIGGVLAFTSGGVVNLAVADVITIHNASVGAINDTLVMRGSTGQILAGSFSAVTTFGAPGSITAQGNATIAGSIISASLDTDRIRLFGTTDIQFGPPGGPTLVAADVTLIHTATSLNTASALVQRNASGKVLLGGVQLGTGASNGMVNNWHFHPVSQVLVGGAPTEQINVNITGSGFAAKPNWGIMIPVNDNLTGTYLITNGATTATNAVCEFRQITGNIVGGTYLAMALFCDVQP